MMTKNYLSITAAVFFVFLGYWFFSNYSLVKKPSFETTTRRTVTTTTQTQPTRTPAANTAQNNQAATSTTATSAPTNQPAQVAAPTAQQQLELEKQKLEIQRQNLATLKARHETQTKQVNNDFPLVIGTNNLQIQNLLDDLQNQRLSRNDVNNSAEAALREQNSAAQLSRDQIDLNIQNTEQSIQRTKDALLANASSLMAGSVDLQNQNLQLQADLTALTDQLRQLKEQRVNVSATVYEQTRNINNISQSQKDNLTSSQNEIQQQISLLRDENVRLQNQSTEARMSLMPLSQQISQAEQAYQDTLNKIRTLELSTVVR